MCASWPSRASSARSSAGSSGSFCGVQLQRQAGAVVDQDVAVAVEDVAARGDHLVFAGAVVLGLGQVLARRRAPAGSRAGRRGPRRARRRRRRAPRSAAPGAAGAGAIVRVAGTRLLGPQHRRPPAAPHAPGSSTRAGRSDAPQAEVDRPAEDEGEDALDQHVADDQAADGGVDPRASARRRRSRARRTGSGPCRAAAAPAGCGSRSARGRGRRGSRSRAGPASRRRAARSAGSRAGSRPRSR